MGLDSTAGSFVPVWLGSLTCCFALRRIIAGLVGRIKHEAIHHPAIDASVSSIIEQPGSLEAPCIIELPITGRCALPGSTCDGSF